MRQALQKLPDKRKNPSGHEQVNVDSDFGMEWDSLQKTLNGFWKSIYNEVVE
jgi:hypothetical protein